MATPNLQLRRERQLRGWSQAYLAEQIDVPDYYLSRWERGEVLPSPFYQQKLCELFGKTAEALGFLPPLHESTLARSHRFDKRVSSTSAGVPAQGGMSVNPFTYGNPISHPARFFGRELEVEQVFSRLRNAEFESTSIVGERRIGKTSLLKYLAHPDTRQRYGLDADTYLFVPVDLQMVDEQITPGQLWHWLLGKIASYSLPPQIQPLLDEIRAAQVIDPLALDELFEHIDVNNHYLVLLLDEFERVTGNPNFPAAFFYGLRSLAIHHHLALITFSRCELIELCHSRTIRSSPFFNIFATIHLGLFSQDEALNLITHSLAETGIHFTDQEQETVFRLAGLHPYFLQVACSCLFDAYMKNLSPDERIRALRKTVREETRPHLAFAWHSSDEQEKGLLLALAVLVVGCQRQGPTWNIQHLHKLVSSSGSAWERLERRGLVLSLAEMPTLLNETFAEWIWNEVTDIGHNQQSFAEWLASHRHVTATLQGLPNTRQQALSQVLSRVNSEYRETLLSWLLTPPLAHLVDEWGEFFFQVRWGQPG